MANLAGDNFVEYLAN